MKNITSSSIHPFKFIVPFLYILLCLLPCASEAQNMASGHVVDYAGANVEGARVSFFIDGSWISDSTDNWGEFTITLPDVSVEESYEGYHGDVEVKIYTVTGQNIRTITTRADNGIRWDGRDDNGKVTARGVYLYRIQAGSEKLTGKIVKPDTYSTIPVTVDFFNRYGEAVKNSAKAAGLRLSVEVLKDGYETLQDTVTVSDDMRLVINRIPRLISALPDTVFSGYDLSGHIYDDSAGSWIPDTELVKIVNGVIIPADSTQSLVINVTIEYKDGVNLDLVVNVESVFRYDTKDGIAPIIDAIADITVNEGEAKARSLYLPSLIQDNVDGYNDLKVSVVSSDSLLVSVAVVGDSLFFSRPVNNPDDANGSSLVTVYAVDREGNKSSRAFNYVINPMTDVRGSLLDTDTWKPNTSLQGFVAVLGDTVMTDVHGNYTIQIAPSTIDSLTAWYTQNGAPASFIRTVRNVDGRSDKEGLDVTVVTYLDINTTPEEFRILAWESNFKSGGNSPYEGAKALSKEMKDYLIRINYNGDEFTENELGMVRQVIADSINVYLKHSIPLVDTTSFMPTTDVEKKDVIRWAKYYWENTSFGERDLDGDGRIDYCYISTRGHHPNYYDEFISGLLEEGYASRGEFFGVGDNRLAGKTLAHEATGIIWVQKADIKFIRMIEGITYEVGQLKPKMSINDILELPNQ